MNPRQRSFSAGLASLMKRWGLPAATGQLYAYLLLRDSPTDLDTMAADLQTSKSGLSVAARQLESWFLVRSATRTGSRRVYYEVDGDVERLLRINHDQLRDFASTLREGADLASGSSRERLEGVAGVFDLYVEASRAALEALAAPGDDGEGGP